MEKDEQKQQDAALVEQPPAAWEPMQLTYVADVRDITMPGILKAGTQPESGGAFKIAGQAF